MIDISDCATKLQDMLNANTSGFVYAIHTEAGEYDKAIKKRTEKTLCTNGMLRFGPSSIVPAQGLTVATQNAVLELCVQIFDREKTEEITAAHRAVLDGVFGGYKVENMDDGFTVTMLSSLADTGYLSVREGVGSTVTFSVNLEYTYVQNGLNSNNCTFKLDGYDIPYSSAKITKQPMAQADCFSNSGGQGLNVNTSFVRSFDFQVPATTDGLGTIIAEQLLGSYLDNLYTLTVKYGADAEEKTYNVVFGTVDVAIEGIDNAGYTIALVETLVNTEVNSGE